MQPFHFKVSSNLGSQKQIPEFSDSLDEEDLLFDLSKNVTELKEAVNEEHSLDPIDIGNLDIKSLSDQQKYRILTNHFVPPKDYNFPSVFVKGKNAFAGFHHLNSYKYLVFSHVSQGYFCKICCSMTGGDFKQGMKIIDLGFLVNAPLKNFKQSGNDCTLKKHEKTGYHIQAVRQSNDFLKTFVDPSKNISNISKQHFSKMYQRAKRTLCTITDAILTCATENIPLRGHRDSGKIEIENNESQGCFK